jgi:hypothetical protein
MKGYKKWAGVVLCIMATGCVNLANLYGRGTVRDWESKQAIAAVELELHCQKYQFHGSRALRVVHAVSAADGSYSFAFRDTADCDWLYVTPSKPGYRSATGLPVGIGPETGHIDAVVPLRLWMVPEERAAWLGLQDTLRRDGEPLYFAESRTARQTYARVNANFQGSSRTALTPEQHRWVRAHYCERLQGLWEALEESDRHDFAQAIGYVLGHADVVAYCARDS